MRSFAIAVLGALTILAGSPVLAQSHASICTRDYNSSLNLRNGPSRGNYIIASVPSGDYVRLLNWVWGGDGQRWWRVEYNGLVGWMRGDYLCR